MFERFSDRGRRVLVLAQEEARLLHHGLIGTEHLLLGLLHEGEGPAARALEATGVSLEAVRAKVAVLAHPSDSRAGGAPPFTPRAKKALELALREALQLGHHSIGTGHIFLGLLREGEGVAPQALRALGADVDQLRDEVIRQLNDEPGDAPPAEGAGATARLVPSGPSPWRVGTSWRVEVVHAGRRPEDTADAYRTLGSVLARFGVRLETLDSSEVSVSSVDTEQGPGILLVVTSDAERGGESDEH